MACPHISLLPANDGARPNQKRVACSHKSFFSANTVAGSFRKDARKSGKTRGKSRGEARKNKQVTKKARRGHRLKFDVFCDRRLYILQMITNIKNGNLAENIWKNIRENE